MEMCLLRDEKRSQELNGGSLELVGSSDDGHEEEVPETELRTSREAAESWKEQPMPGGKVIACESGDGAKRFVKRKTETSVTELKRWCCGSPVEVSNTEGISIGGTVSWDMKVLPAIHVGSTIVQMAVDDEDEE